MATMIQHTADPDRTRAATREKVNARLDREAGRRLRLAASEDEEQLRERIQKIGREWNFDRLVEAEASITGLTGIVLGATVDSRFLFMPGVASAMLFVHALHGWYPLLPILRRIGMRSQDEIDREYYALKAMRGDFERVTSEGVRNRAEAAWKAVIA
jgi:hypothetical protein